MKYLSSITVIGSINGLTLTSAAYGFTIVGGTAPKTLTISNTLTLAGNDGSTLNIGGGGTLGTAAFTNSSVYATANSPALTGIPTAPTASVGTNTTQIATTACAQAKAIAMAIALG